MKHVIGKKTVGWTEKDPGDSGKREYDGMEDLYEMTFKRKSFHLFRNIGNSNISSAEIENIQEKYKTFLPLCPDIKTAIRIVPAEETTCTRGQQYCILLYSEKKDNYLQNIGYLGEQLDLYLVSQNIGTLWFGIGKTDEVSFYNRIDVGIFLCFLDLCLQHKNMKYIVELHKGEGTDVEKTKVATYKMQGCGGSSIHVYKRYT